MFMTNIEVDNPPFGIKILGKIEHFVCKDWQLTLDERHMLISELSWNPIHEVNTEKLKLFKLCAWRVQKQLTKQHKMNRVTVAEEFSR